jgi:molybdopterin/thiamine biosynthesis adenylyltransferase
MSNHITIVGVGALGSHLVQFLRGLDASLTLIDFDRVEQKNTASQFHGKPHVGKLKVEAIKQSMSLLWGSKLDTISNKLTKDNAEQLLRGKLVVDCLDNGESRRIIQERVRATGRACLHGALAADGAFGRVVWDEDFVIDDEAGLGAATCEDGRHLPFIATVSSLMARAVQEYLATGKKIGFSVTPNGGAIRI